MSINYFDGINFVCWGEYEYYRERIEKFFMGYYGLQYHHRGNISCSCDHGETYHGEGPHVLLCYPEHYYDYGPGGGDGRYHMFVCFNGSRAKQYQNSGLLPAVGRNPLIPICGAESFYRRLRELHAVLNNHPPRYCQAVNLLEGLLLQICEEQQAAPGRNDSRARVFEELSRRIAGSPMANWDFSREAEKMGISYPHFRRLFLKYLDEPAGHYVLRCRLKAAAERLCLGHDKISVIAEETGFYDVYHFSRLFKQYYQLPPATYRQEFFGWR